MHLSRSITLTALTALAGTACATRPTAPAASADPLVSLPTAQLRWQDVPGTEGAVSYANTQGNILSDGAGFYSAFVRFKAGHRLPAVPVPGQHLRPGAGDALSFSAAAAPGGGRACCG